MNTSQKRAQQNKKKQRTKDDHWFKRTWNFLWNDDSILSWVVNIVLAFVIIKFIFFPMLSLMFQTELPLVAVVSGSMEHKLVHPCESFVLDGICVAEDKSSYALCGKSVIEDQFVTDDVYWDFCGAWYEQAGIEKNDFEDFAFSDGFNVGDVMFIYGKQFDELQVGDVAVFRSLDGIPIIHRIVSINEVSGTFQTKGDHNAGSIEAGPRSELAVTQDQYIGVASFRVPWVGYVKLIFVRAVLAIGSIF